MEEDYTKCKYYSMIFQSATDFYEDESISSSANDNTSSHTWKLNQRNNRVFVIHRTQLYSTINPHSGFYIHDENTSNNQLKKVSIWCGNSHLFFINYGATLTNFLRSDPHLQSEYSILLEDNNTFCQSFQEIYNQIHGYYGGCIVGPVANRISNGKIPLSYLSNDQNKQGYIQLDCNDNNKNHLHGGKNGYHSRYWTFEGFLDDNEYVGVLFSLVSIQDGSSLPSYPESVKIEVKYLLKKDNDGNEFVVEIIGNCIPNPNSGLISPAVLNITHHPYWCLGKEHYIQSNCSRYLVKDKSNGGVPTGEIATISESEDGGVLSCLTSLISATSDKKMISKGVDHCLICDDDDHKSESKEKVKLAAILSSNNLEMRISTNQPAIQVYTGDWLPQNIKRTTCCVESQGYVDAPNNPRFPSIRLEPKETYYHKIVHEFKQLLS